MKIKVTKQHLKENNACRDGYEYWLKVGKQNLFEFINHCIKDKDNKDTDESPINYANWLIVRCMDRKQYIRYAVYAAKQCLAKYEEVHPDDSRVRDAIKAAAKVIKNNTAKNRSAASAAWSAAWSAARSAAWSAASVAWSAARSAARSAERSAARSAAWSAASAASAAWSAESAESAESAARSAESAARSAARSVAWSAASAAWSDTQIKVLRYGIRIMREEGELG